MTPCRFDESLPRFVEILDQELGAEVVNAGVMLREASGRLSFYSATDVSEEQLQRVSERAKTALGEYVRPARAIVPPRDSGLSKVLAEAETQSMLVLASLPAEPAVEGQVEPDAAAGSEPRYLRYLERRIVGADWLPSVRATSASPTATPRVAFTSLKGGVGRSTALAVVAAELARQGKNLLVIDLDLEAPGIGSLLLDDDRLPTFGVTDYLTERNLGKVDPALVGELVGTSALTRGQGLVHVVPAVGKAGRRSPANYLAKVSRAMQEAVEEDSGPLSLADKVREMLEQVESLRSYDLVLLDVRAGLAELAAGPLLALQAETLIFATNQRQTFEDLEYLLAYLSSITACMPSDAEGSPWRRLKMVHAKAATAASVAPFSDKLWGLFYRYLYEQSEELEAFNFGPEDEDAPHWPLRVPLNPAFADFDPVHDRNKLVEEFYTETFKQLIRYVELLLLPEESGERHGES